MTLNQLFENIKKKQSFLCVGLDTDIDKIPQFLLKTKNPVFEFNKSIINATQNLCIAFKMNTAFYECLGVKGWKNLKKTAEYIKLNYPDIFLIADAKRGDIGNTSKMYAKAFFEELNFDAITVAPYMGEDSVIPFLSYKDKWTILLALTSNKGSDDFQFFTDPDNNRLFEKVIRQSNKWGAENIMYVVGATKAEMLKDIRKIIPDNFLLVPGIGTQGGKLEDVVENGMNGRCGLIINSSREIIYADSTKQFSTIAKEKALEIQQKMEKLLHEKGLL